MTRSDGGTASLPWAAWVRVNTIGWVLGLAAVILLAIVSDVVGGNAQFMVGAGMGAGIGYMQGRSLRDRIRSPRAWAWSSTIGMALPFVAWDVGAMLGHGDVLSLPPCVLLGALLVGTLQYGQLRSESPRAAWWIPSVALGWAVPTAMVAANDVDILDPWGNTLFLLALFFGGGVMGAITGRPLAWVLRATNP